MRKLILSLAMLGLLAGCGTLAPNGAYSGDKVLYDADMTLVTAYTTIHGFVTWESAHPEMYKASPQIKQAADKMRVGAPKWFASAFALRDAYETNPTPGTRDSLQQAITILRTAMVEATKYLAEAGVN